MVRLFTDRCPNTGRRKASLWGRGWSAGVNYVRNSANVCVEVGRFQLVIAVAAYDAVISIEHRFDISR